MASVFSIIISIHAPARGATKYVNAKIYICIISIHAPARGATQCNEPGRHNRPEFQSTLPRGERHGSQNHGKTPSYFNPRSREGSDLSFARLTPINSNFNPRSREGSDLGKARTTEYVVYFNPRSREGSDDSCTISAITASAISIHAPARGATTANIVTLGDFIEFQSTLPRGERHAERIILLMFHVFQSTLPRGERPVIVVLFVYVCNISIHAPARGATTSACAN